MGESGGDHRLRHRGGEAAEDGRSLAAVGRFVRVGREEEMVVLVVATASDPASIGPAAAFLAMPGWSPGPPIAVRKLLLRAILI